MQKNGIVTKGVGGLYEVLLSDGSRILCRGKGILKKDDGKLLVGDRVSVKDAQSERGEAVIGAIAPRDNALIRPPLANVGAIVLTVAAVSPMPALSTLDRMLSVCEYEGILPILALTKTDLSEDAAERLGALYLAAGYEVFPVSSVTGEGTDALRARIVSIAREEKTVAFAGASGVGKSTLLGTLFPHLSLATGALSEKTQRGRHTTRTVELFPYEGGFLADTPGFSLLDFERFDFIPFEALPYTFKEFRAYIGRCRYDDCTHTKEEECAIREAVASGAVAKSRHDSYLELYPILKEKDLLARRKNKK